MKKLSILQELAEDLDESASMEAASLKYKDCETVLRRVDAMKDSWTCPGGMSWDWFKHRFILAIVPDGWAKEEFGRNEIGKGHVAFVNLYLRGALSELDSNSAAQFNATPLLQSLLLAIKDGDKHFFPNFGEAAAHWRRCMSKGTRVLFPRKRKNEYLLLCTILEFPRPLYRVRDLVADVERLFREEAQKRQMQYNKVQKVVARLRIKTRSTP